MASESVHVKKPEDLAPSDVVVDVKHDLEAGDGKEEDTDMIEKVGGELADEIEDDGKGHMEIDEEVEDQSEKGDLEDPEEKIEVKGEEISTKERISVKKKDEEEDQAVKDGGAEIMEVETEVSDDAVEKGEGKEDEDEEGDDEEEEEVIKKVRKRRKASDREQVTPVTPSERPTRERKLVKRYSVPTPSRSPASKLFIEKGSGTQLKDIPNVSFMLSKRKPDEILQLLHSVLYGKKAKVHSLKKNIGQFSGYVWAENEEKQRAKIKERLDKCVKEKLIEFCYVLNIPINKAVSRKEDLCIKLLEFLESPQSTTETLLADKEQKGKKRKSVTPSKTSPGEVPIESAKKQKATIEISEKKQKQSPKVEEETDDKTDSSDAKDDSDKENVEDKEKESDSEQSDKDEPKEQKKSSSKKNVKEKSRSKSKSSPVEKQSSASKSVKKGSSSTPKDATPSSSSKSKAKNQKVEKELTPKDATPVSSAKSKSSASKKQKAEKESEYKNASGKEKATRKKEMSRSPAKKRTSANDSGKGKKVKKAKAEPSRGEMHAIVVDILKEVDFNTATLSDIIRQLGTHFGMDLMHRKAEVKEIIADVINSMSDDEDENEAEEKTETAEKEEKKDGSDNEKKDGSDNEKSDEDGDS